jgi:hypothetical protein
LSGEELRKAATVPALSALRNDAYGFGTCAVYRSKICCPVQCTTSWRIAQFVVFVATVLSMAAAGLGAANAAGNEEAARAQCREKFVPVVKDCVRQKVRASGGSPARFLAKSR